MLSGTFGGAAMELVAMIQHAPFAHPSPVPPSIDQHRRQDTRDFHRASRSMSPRRPALKRKH